MLALWLIASVLSAGIVAINVARSGGQKMWIMDLVWPITALWAATLDDTPPRLVAVGDDYTRT